MHYDVNTIEEYLEAIPVERKDTFLRLFDLIHEYFPEVKGSIKYKMPVFEPIGAIASQKHYISVYINRHDLVEKYKTELGGLSTGKSCIRFKNPDHFQEKVLRRIFQEIKM